MEKITLEVKKRDLVGKKVKDLRESGLLPANIYGKGVTSIAITLPTKEFLALYQKAGETTLVELKVDGQSFHTLISDLQIDPVSRLPIHAEFHAVSLTEKIRAHVPVEIEGESPAVAAGTGLLLQTLNEVEVEALPANLPERFVVDASKLTEIDQQVTVADLPPAFGVEILTDSTEVAVRVAPAVSAEAQKEAEAEAAAAAAASAEAPAVPAEGETPAEGATTPEASTPEE